MRTPEQQIIGVESIAVACTWHSLRARPFPATEQEQVFTGQTILLVEDERFVRESAALILTGAGYNVVVANNLPEAWRLFFDQPENYDLLLTDMVLPGGSGRDLLQRIKTLRPGLPAMLMTGYGDEIAHSMQYPDRVPCLRKPFSASDLIGRIADLIGERPVTRIAIGM